MSFGKITQDEYIEILFNDLCFSIKAKHDHLRDFYGVENIEDLPRVKKSELIDYLKEVKERRNANNNSEYST